MKYLLSTLLLCMSLNSYSQLFWQVTSKKSQKKSYILATHPLLPAKVFDSIPGVFRAFNRCNVVISTYDSYTVDAETQLKKAALLPFQKPIKDYLSETPYKTTDDELKKSLKMGLKEMALMHPAIIRQLYANELFKQATNIADDAQADSYFQRVAALKGIKVVGLEDYSLYIASLFDGSKIQLYADKLADDISRKEQYRSDLNDLLHYYQGNNWNKFIETANKLESISGTEIQKKELTENQLLKLTDLLQSNNCFYTVDSKQLNSQSGIIAQLLQAGYDVKPYKFSPSKKK